MIIDLKTMSLVLLIMHILQFFVFTHLYYANKSLREIKWWVFWCVTGILSFLLIVIRDIFGAPSPVIILQNSFMVLGAVFIYVGVLRFYGMKEKRGILAGMMLGYVIILTVFTVIYENVRVHASVTNLYLSFFAIITALVLIKFKPKKNSASLSIIYYAFLFHGLVFALRGIFVISGVMSRQNFFSPDPLNILTFIDGIITSVLWTFGFVVMINQRINDQVKETLDHFKQIFNTSPDAATITRLRDGRIIDVNDHFVTLLGYTKQESLGRSVISLWKNPKERLDLALMLSDKGYCDNFEAEFIRKDGSFMTGLISAKLIDLKGVPHIIAMTRDITKMKEDEKEKNRLKIELDQSHRLQSIGTLAAGIAHEINSPLQFTNDNIDFISNAYNDIIKLVSTYKSLMMSCYTDQDKANAKETIFSIEKKINLEFLTNEMPEALSQTKDGIARIRRIVNAMKQYSHMNNEEKKPANIIDTLENAEIISRNEWKYHADLVNNNDPDLPFLNCYEPELNQVFMNLIVNAAHATKDAVDKKIIEKGMIEVSARLRNGRILVSVKDNGTGIPDKVRERVYDPFFTTKEVGKGTGQGLAMAHKVVIDRHGGKIWFETEINKGTTFFVEIPL